MEWYEIVFIVFSGLVILFMLFCMWCCIRLGDVDDDE